MELVEKVGLCLLLLRVVFKIDKGPDKPSLQAMTIQGQNISVSFLCSEVKWSGVSGFAVFRRSVSPATVSST
jgi:hypothetical protein